MSIAEKLTTIAQNEQRVYDAGYDKGVADFWDGVQLNGNRTSYSGAFQNWGMEYIRPKYFVRPTSRMTTMFAYSEKLKKVEAKYFDLSGCSVNQEAGTAGVYAVFNSCWALEEIEDIGIPAGGMYQTYAYCRKLKTISVVRVIQETKFNSTFAGCDELENVEFEGVIGQNGLNLRWSAKLSASSIRSIVNALSTDTTGLTVTLSQTARQAAFTDEEWAALIATKPNWTIALI